MKFKRTIGGYVIVVDGGSFGRVYRAGSKRWLARAQGADRIPHAGKTRKAAAGNLLRAEGVSQNVSQGPPPAP